MYEMKELPLPDPLEYYILSIKDPLNRQWLLWWGPNNGGYTHSLDDAGRYTRKEVLARLRYYHNGESTLAIPCELADEEAMRAVPFENPFVRLINDAKEQSGYNEMCRRIAQKETEKRQCALEELKERLKFDAEMKAIRNGDEWDPTSRGLLA